MSNCYYNDYMLKWNTRFDLMNGSVVANYNYPKSQNKNRNNVNRDNNKNENDNKRSDSEQSNKTENGCIDLYMILLKSSDNKKKNVSGDACMFQWY